MANRQLSIDTFDTNLQARSKAITDHAAIVDKAEQRCTRLETDLLARTASIEERERRLKSEQFVLEDARVEFASTQKDVAQREKACADTERSHRIKEEEITRRNEVSVKKEVDVSLREAECRVREKKINIAFQEQQLQ